MEPPTPSKTFLFVMGLLFLLGGLSFFFFPGVRARTSSKRELPGLGSSSPSDRPATSASDSSIKTGGTDPGGRRVNPEPKEKVQNPGLKELFIRGRVREKNSGKPIPGVQLIVGQEGGKGFQILGRSDSSGMVQAPVSSLFQGKKEGLFFFLKKSGFQPFSAFIQKSAIQKKEKEQQCFDWTLRPGAGVAGRVFAEGKPVKGARIYLFEENKGAGYGDLSWSRLGGFFLVAGKPGKSYDLYAQHARWGAGKVLVNLPRDGTIPFLPKVPLFPVSVLQGKLLSPDGLGIPHVEIVADLIGPDNHFDNVQNGAVGGDMETGEDGSFRFLGLHPGSYHLDLGFPPVYDDKTIQELRKKKGETDKGECRIQISSFLARLQFGDQGGAPI